MADDLEHLTQQFHQLSNTHGQKIEELKGLKVCTASMLYLEHLTLHMYFTKDVVVIISCTICSYGFFHTTIFLQIPEIPTICLKFLSLVNLFLYRKK